MAGLILTVLSGLPGSGKSTEARRIGDATGATVIARDDYRKWFPSIEEGGALTLLLIDAAALSLRNGFSIVVDSPNLHPVDQVRWTELARLAMAELRWVHMATPTEECVKRDARRPEPNGAAAVRLTAQVYASQIRKLEEAYVSGREKYAPAHITTSQHSPELH